MYQADFYNQSKNIKLGKETLPPIYSELIDWVSTSFSVSALNFALSTNRSYHQQFLQIMLETKDDCNKMETKIHDREILSRYVPIHFNPERPADPTKSDALPHPGPGEKQEFHVTYVPFETKVLEEAKEKLEAHGQDYIRKIENKYNQHIHKILCNYDVYHVLIFHSEKMRLESFDNGIMKSIINDFLTEYRKFDEFGYFTEESVKYANDSREHWEEIGQQDSYYFR